MIRVSPATTPGSGIGGGIGAADRSYRPARARPAHPVILLIRTPSVVSSSAVPGSRPVATVTSWPSCASSRESVLTCSSMPPMNGS